MVWRERGFVLLTLWLGLFLVGYSLFSVKFLRYALPLFAGVDIIAAVGVVAGIEWLLRKSWLSPISRVTVAAMTLTVCVTGPFLAQQSATPFPSLFRNAIGERIAPAGAIFPEETYDYGVREAVEAVAGVAGPDATILSDAPAVVAYYLAHSGRTDLRVRSLSADGLPQDHRSTFVIVQAEHLTFENRDLVSYLEQHFTPALQFYEGDVRAAQVFHLPRS